MFQFRAKAQLELDRLNKERNKSDESLKSFYKTHPVEYIVERFNIRPEVIDWSLIDAYKEHKYEGTPNPLKTILDALVAGEWVGVESAKGVGKTFLGACIVFWFLECFENSVVVTVAPKEDQLNLHIWKEISLLYPKFNKGTLMSKMLRMSDDPGKDKQPTWFATKFVAGAGTVETTAQNAAGFHAEHLLIILEETPGINQKVIDALISTCSSPHNLILAFGNPDHQQDNLHKFCAHSNVRAVRISGFDHPNVVLKDASFIPGAQSVQGLERLLTVYRTPQNPLYQSHARGISPGSGPKALIKYNWCEAAVQLHDKYLDEHGIVDLSKIPGEKSLGADVANSAEGDDGSIVKGKGSICYSAESFPCPNSNELGTRINNICLIEGISKRKVKIDGIGVGAGTVNELIRLGYRKQDINFIGSESPVKIRKMTEQFNNLRSQAWWMTSIDLRDGLVGMPYDPELMQDLSAPEWELSNGKICVESKKDIKKRLGRSPNKGDAFVYWYWNVAYKIIYNVSAG